MSDIWKMVLFSVAFATLLVGFVVVRAYLRPRPAQIKACIADMKYIEPAKSTWAIEQGKGTKGVPGPGETNYFSGRDNHCVLGR